MDEQVSIEEKNEVKETNLTSMDLLIFLVLIVPFFWGAIILLNEENPMFIFMFLTFMIVLVPLTYIKYIKKIIDTFKVRRHGEVIHATVMEYSKDDLVINGSSTQIIKLLINKDNGDRFIYYQTRETNKKYEIGSDIELYVYNDLYLIKDSKDIRKNSLISAIVTVSLLILFSNMVVSCCVKYVFKTSYHDIEMSNILKKHSEVLTNYQNLEYKIPDNYQLMIYEDSDYSFISRNDSHFCTISIYSYTVTMSPEKINSCISKVGNEVKNDEEMIINNSKWCYETNDYYDHRHETYYRKNEELLDYFYNVNHMHYYHNDGKNYFLIDLYSYDDSDEQCTVDFSNFVDTLKIK